MPLYSFANYDLQHIIHEILFVCNQPICKSEEILQVLDVFVSQKARRLSMITALLYSLIPAVNCAAGRGHALHSAWGNRPRLPSWCRSSAPPFWALRVHRRAAAVLPKAVVAPLAVSSSSAVFHLPAWQAMYSAPPQRSQALPHDNRSCSISHRRSVFS